MVDTCWVTLSCRRKNGQKYVFYLIAQRKLTSTNWWNTIYYIKFHHLCFIQRLVLRFMIILIVCPLSVSPPPSLITVVDVRIAIHWTRSEDCDQTGVLMFFFLPYDVLGGMWNLSRLMTKPTKWVCALRRLRSAWASAQSDHSRRCPHSYPLNAQRRLWSDWASDFVGFVMRRLIGSWPFTFFSVLLTDHETSVTCTFGNAPQSTKIWLFGHRFKGTILSRINYTRARSKYNRAKKKAQQKFK